MEILYVHCLEQSTFVPTHVSSQWDGILRTLSWGRRERREGVRARLTMWIEGTSPTGRGREMKRRNREDEMKCRDLRMDRTELCIRGEGSGESTFPWISPLLQYEQLLTEALQTTLGSVELMQYIVNN